MIFESSIDSSLSLKITTRTPTNSLPSLTDSYQTVLLEVSGYVSNRNQAQEQIDDSTYYYLQ